MKINKINLNNCLKIIKKVIQAQRILNNNLKKILKIKILTQAVNQMMIKISSLKAKFYLKILPSNKCNLDKEEAQK